MVKPTFTSVIANRGFRYLWINQILIQLAFNTLNFALIIWVFKLTDSNLAVASLMIAIYLPALLFGMLAGVYVDIANRKKIILTIDLLFALAFLVFLLIKGSYPLLLINTFFVNSLAQFFMPTESSSIPLLVNKKQLFLANSLFSMTLYGSFMIGFVLAGPLMSFFGINSIFYLGFGYLFLAWILAQNLPSIKVSQSKSKESLYLLSSLHSILKLTVSETRQTIKIIKGKLNVVVSIGLLAAVQGVIGVLAVLISAYMERVLKIHATDASFVLMVPLGLGMVVGALIVGKFAHNIPKRTLVIPAIVLAGMLFILMASVPTMAHFIQLTELPEYLRHPRFFFKAPSLSLMFAIGAFVMGVCAVSIIIPAQTVLQENTSVKIRGKVFGALGVLMNVFAAVPVILAGVFADLFGVTPIFFSMGILIFIIGLLALRPSSFFQENHLSFRIREFLGLGHWEGK